MATHPDYPLLTAKEFLEIDFGERKAELDNGVIRMMAGGTARHAEVQANLLDGFGRSSGVAAAAPTVPTWQR